MSQFMCRYILFFTITITAHIIGIEFNFTTRICHACPSIRSIDIAYVYIFYNKSTVFSDYSRFICILNCSPSSRQLKKYKFFLPAEIYLLAVFMQLASKFHVFPLVSKFQDSFANVCCCSNLYNLRSFLREYFYQ